MLPDHKLNCVQHYACRGVGVPPGELSLAELPLPEVTAPGWPEKHQVPATFVPLDQAAPGGEAAAAGSSSVAPSTQVLADQAEQQRWASEETRLKGLQREREEACRYMPCHPCWHM